MYTHCPGLAKRLKGMMVIRSLLKVGRQLVVDIAKLFPLGIGDHRLWAALNTLMGYNA